MIQQGVCWYVLFSVQDTWSHSFQAFVHTLPSQEATLDAHVKFHHYVPILFLFSLFGTDC